MKKVYLLFVFSILGCLAVSAQLAQRTTAPAKGKFKSNLSTTHSLRRVTPSNNQPNNLLWSDDFSTPANWTISHAAGTSSDWAIGTNPPSGAAPIDPIASATATNNFAIFDSDALCDSVNGQIGNLTTASMIDLIGFPNIRLTFSQYYARYYDSTFVFVSNDSGATWTKFSINTNLGPNDFNGNDINLNPDIVTLDISSVAGNQDSVLIRFQFYSPTSLTGTNGCAYAWMLDDISITDVPSTDAAIAPAFAGEYAVIPSNQPENFKLRGKVINNGNSPITGAKIDFIILDGQGNQIYTDSSALSGTINPTDTSGYLNALNSTTYTLPGVDPFAYTIVQTVTLAGDSDNTNDMTFGFIAVDDSIYARDYVHIDGNISQTSYGFPTGSGYMGQMFHIYHASQITSSTFFLVSPTVGDSTRVVCYSVSGGLPQNLIGTTNYYTITQADTAIPHDFVTLMFQTPINVTAGDYFFALQQVVPSGFLSIASTPDVYTPQKVYYKSTTGLNWTPFDNQGFYSSLVLEVNNPSATLVGIPTVKKPAAFKVFPNPSNGLVYVIGNGIAEKDVRITVLNPLGQVVKSMNYDSFVSSSIDLSSFPAGIYTVNIHTAKEEINKTVILK